MYTRNLTDGFLQALNDTPVIFVNGSRQVGKSTFVQSLLSQTHLYYTLDDPTTLAAIKKDPLLFLEGLQRPVVIDEVQRIPELFLPLKKLVDRQRKPGFFVLTGSANILTLPRLADSLAGRMEMHTLWPLSQGEIQGKKEDFITLLFNDPSRLMNAEKQSGNHETPVTASLSLEQLTGLVTQGGYPEILQRPSFNRRQKWFESYLITILEKDIKDLSHIEGLSDLPNLMKLLAGRCGSLLNMSDISRAIKIPQTTLKRYFALLEGAFLIALVPAWTKNLTKRIVKTPKIYLNDTGILTHLVGYDHDRLLKDTSFLGHVLENFVVMEIRKQMTWSQQSCQIYHYRTQSQKEVDIILEKSDSRIVAIEVKLSSSVQARDFAGIHILEEETGKDFHKGVVLYMGDTVVPFGPNKYAIPLSYLWNHPDC